MVFHRKTKKTHKKKRGKITYTQIATKVYKDIVPAISWIKRLMNVEIMSHNVETTLAINSTGVVQLLSDINLGNTTNTRTGRQVKALNLDIKGFVTLNTTAGHDIVRFMLVRADTSDTPTFANVLRNTVVESFRQLNDVRLFKVIYDKTFSLDTNSKNRQSVYIHKRLSHRLQWDQTTDTEVYGHLFLMILGTEATNTSTFKFAHRLRYVDN